MPDRKREIIYNCHLDFAEHGEEEAVNRFTSLRGPSDGLTAKEGDFR